jgi:hypothetical protein
VHGPSAAIHGTGGTAQANLRALVADFKKLRLPKLANVGGVVKSLESVSEALSFAEAGGPDAITGEDSLGAWVYDKLHPDDGAPPVVPVKAVPAPTGVAEQKASVNAADTPKVDSAERSMSGSKRKDSPPVQAPAEVALQGKLSEATAPCLIAASTTDSKLTAIQVSIDKLCDTLGELRYLKDELESLAQHKVVMSVDGRELGRVVTNVLGQEFQRPSVSSSRVDANRKPSPAGRRG